MKKSANPDVKCPKCSSPKVYYSKLLKDHQCQKCFHYWIETNNTEEDELLEDFTILINAWVSSGQGTVPQLAESLAKVARKQLRKS